MRMKMTDQPTQPDTLASVAAEMANKLSDVTEFYQTTGRQYGKEFSRRIYDLLARYHAITSQPEKPDNSTVKDSQTVKQPSEYWVRNMAEKEDACTSISVGGLATDLMVIQQTNDIELRKKLSENLQHHNDEEVSKAMHLWQQVKDMGLTVEQVRDACEIYKDLMKQFNQMKHVKIVATTEGGNHA